LSPTDPIRDARWIYLFLWCVICMVLVWRPLQSLWDSGLQDENTSHVFLIPFISVWLLFIEKVAVPKDIKKDFRGAFPFLIPAVALTAWAWSPASAELAGKVTIAVAALVFYTVAGFVFFFGGNAARRSSFPLAFLFFAIPLPPFLLQKFIYWLQAGSAAISEFIFELSGFPVMREGFIFRLPRISIEVAQECSGIRSSIALVILAVLVAHFAFRPLWKKIVFVVAGLLMMIVKNGIRIASLTLLANYVNPDFLYGKLHHRGGVVFFLIGLALLIPVYRLLRRGEIPKSGAETTSATV